MNALADYLSSIEELTALAGRPGRGANTADEVRYVLQVKVRGTVGAFTQGAKDSADRRYCRLAIANVEHFDNPSSPSSRSRPAISSGTRYHQLHEQALLAAFEDGQARKSTSRALLEEGFAAHFLEDSFASGHLLTPRLQAKQYWDAKYPQFWDNVIAWLERSFAQVYAVLEHLPMTVVHGAVIQKRSFRKAAAKMGSLTFGDLVGLAVHDYYDYTGVAASAGGEAVRIYGDAGLERGDTKRLVVNAVAVSLGEVKRVHAAGVGAAPSFLRQPTCGYDAARKVVNDLRGARGLFAAERLIPTPAPIAHRLKWRVATYQDLHAIRTCGWHFSGR